MSKIKDYHITPLFCLVVYILIFAVSFIKTSKEFSVNAFLLVFVTQILVFILPSIIYKRIKGPIKYKELGFDGILLKPVTVEKLKDLIG